MAEDIWDELVEKYGISGYTDKIIFVKLETLIELHEKAELWEQYAIYDNEKEAEIPVKDLIVAYERLEAVKTWYNKNKPDLYALLTKMAWSELCKILEAEG